MSTSVAVMEEEMTNDGGVVDRSTSTTSDIPLLAQPEPYDDSYNHKVVVPNAQSLIKLHERIIDEVSLIQRRWIQKRSRAITSIATTSAASTTTTPTTNENVDDNDKIQFQGVSLPPSIIRQNKLDLYKRLHELRKHRMALMAKIKVVKRRRKTSQKSTLYHHVQREHQQMGSDTSNTDDVAAVKGSGHNLRLLCDSDYQRHVWHYIQERRQMKCIQAAYRLTGISVTLVPDNNNNIDSELMMIRFDIDHNNSYDCTFDIVHFATVASTSESESRRENMDDDRQQGTNRTHKAQLFLRLVNHNLPAAIPLTTIFQKAVMSRGHQFTAENSKVVTNTTILMLPIGFNMSSILLDQSLNSNDVPSSAEQQIFMTQLQCVTQQIYHSCHAYHVRNDIYEYLHHLVVQNGDEGNSSPVPYSIQQLQRTYVPHQSSIYKTIDFHIVHQLSSIDQIQITLHYTSDLCRLKAHQPTSVHVKILSPSNHMDDILFNDKRDIQKKQWSSSVLQHLEGTVTDMEDERNNDDHNHNEFIESTIRSFRTLPIQNAIQVVTDAMTEY